MVQRKLAAAFKLKFCLRVIQDPRTALERHMFLFSFLLHTQRILSLIYSTRENNRFQNKNSIIFVQNFIVKIWTQNKQKTPMARLVFRFHLK